jgi:hypothetical protein
MSFRMLWMALLITIGLAACAPVSKSSKYGADLVAAEAAVQRAHELGFAWAESDTLISGAKHAAREGRAAESARLAQQARSQGELAINQFYLERAKQVRLSLMRLDLSAQHRTALAEADAQIQKSSG